jgi:hypothetical protein
MFDVALGRRGSVALGSARYLLGASWIWSNTLSLSSIVRRERCWCRYVRRRFGSWATFDSLDCPGSSHFRLNRAGCRSRRFPPRLSCAGDPGLRVVNHDLWGGARDPTDEPGELVRGAIVKQSPHQWRTRSLCEQHRHPGVCMIVHRLPDQLLRCKTQPAVRAHSHLKLGVVLEAIPVILQPRRPSWVQHEMHRSQVVSMEALSVSHCLDIGEVGRVHEHKHSMFHTLGELGTLGARHLHNGGHRAVLGVGPNQHEQQSGEANNEQPSALGRLCDRENPHCEGEQDSGGQVDHQLESPIGLAVCEMEFRHAVAGQAKTEVASTSRLPWSRSEDGIARQSARSVTINC